MGAIKPVLENTTFFVIVSRKAVEQHICFQCFEGRAFFLGGEAFWGKPHPPPFPKHRTTKCNCNMNILLIS